MADHLLREDATNQAKVEYNASVLRYMRPSSMTLQLYADDIIAKLRKEADMNNVSALNNVFIKVVVSSFRHRFRNHWAAQPARWLNRQRILGGIAFRKKERNKKFVTE